MMISKMCVVTRGTSTIDIDSCENYNFKKKKTFHSKRNKFHKNRSADNRILKMRTAHALQHLNRLLTLAIVFYFLKYLRQLIFPQTCIIRLLQITIVPTEYQLRSSYKRSKNKESCETIQSCLIAK